VKEEKGRIPRTINNYLCQNNRRNYMLKERNRERESERERETGKRGTLTANNYSTVLEERKRENRIEQNRTV
jgi:hypothetical protein